MFKKKITIDVLSKEERLALTSDRPTYQEQQMFYYVEVVRFTNNQSGDVLYVAMKNGLYGGPDDYDSPAEISLYDSSLKELDGWKLPKIRRFVPDICISGYDNCYETVRKNGEILGRLKEGKIYKKALKAVWKKEYDEYYGYKSEQKKEIKEEQRNSFSARFFSAFKKSR
ncbi:MAG: hypothetical protein NC218_05295 [Acetobacter sp.]|nr:hypothetical protein [Acetobacter sp.]